MRVNEGSIIRPWDSTRPPAPRQAPTLLQSGLHDIATYCDVEQIDLAEPVPWPRQQAIGAATGIRAEDVTTYLREIRRQRGLVPEWQGKPISGSGATVRFLKPPPAAPGPTSRKESPMSPAPAVPDRITPPDPSPSPPPPANPPSLPEDLDAFVRLLLEQPLGGPARKLLVTLQKHGLDPRHVITKEQIGPVKAEMGIASHGMLLSEIRRFAGQFGWDARQLNREIGSLGKARGAGSLPAREKPAPPAGMPELPSSMPELPSPMPGVLGKPCLVTQFITSDDGNRWGIILRLCGALADLAHHPDLPAGARLDAARMALDALQPMERIDR